MFEDTEELFANIKRNINEVLNNQANLEDTSVIDGVIIEILSDALVEAGRIAIQKIPEYDYEPLQDLLLENLSNIDHIRIIGNTVKIFDETIGGTLDDLISGQEAAGGHTETPQAPAIWKYGIYLPSVTGSESWMAEKLNLPSYYEVISERISYWESKGVAPYWYFIENGNMGNGRAFPNFSGTNFIAELRAKASDIIRRAKELYIGHIFYDLEEAIDLGVNVNPKSRTRITIYRYKVGKTNVSVQKASSGNIFYRIGNKTYTVDEFKEVIKTL